MGDDELTAIAAELSALPPDEFTAARNARAKGLRPTDRALAARVAALRRPSPAAWLVNLLAHDRPATLDALVRLGARLREAQAAPEPGELAGLAKERRTAIADASREAAALADELGVPVRGPVLEEVAQTLQAALTDASAADAVRSGRLVRPLEAVGLEVDLDGAVAGAAPGAGAIAEPEHVPEDVPAARGAQAASDAPEAKAGPKAKGAAPHDAEASARDAAARAKAEQAAAEASERATAAEAAAADLASRLAELRERIDGLTEARDAAADRVREARERLADAESDLAEAASTLDGAEEELGRVAVEADRADRDARRARATADEAVSSR
ncbi:transposase [Agromyces sp. MMS24-K17]|uniref:transposase n=1 Tax=Agromyces sp. MMS24-K17 TaxID=3372850 RepID=UPI003754D762